MHMDERSEPLICLDETNFNQCELMHNFVASLCGWQVNTFEVFTLHSRSACVDRGFLKQKNVKILVKILFPGYLSPGEEKRSHSDIE